MKRLALLLPAAFLAGCAAVDPYAPSVPDPWYASPPPVYIHPGYGWDSPFGYGGPYGGHRYYHPHPHLHPRPPVPPSPTAATPPAPAAPVPRAAPIPPGAQFGHGEESFRRVDVPKPQGQRGAGPGRRAGRSPYGDFGQP